MNQNLLNGPLAAPATSLPPPANGNQSMEQQALNGGGADNKQQVSNFMNALNRVGAGNNNQFMNTPQQPQPIQTNNQTVAPGGAVGNMPNQNVAQNTMQPGMLNNGSMSAQPSFQPGTFTQAPTNMMGTNTPGYYSNPGAGQAGNVGNSNATTVSQGSTVTPVAGPNNPQFNNVYQQVGNATSGTSPFSALNQTPQAATTNAAGFTAGNYNQVGNPAASVFTNPTQSSPHGGVDANGNPLQTPGAQLVQNILQGNQSIAAHPANIFSDENVKENIKPAEDKIQEFLNNIHAHSYEYKNKGDGPGTYTSPTAQELQKTELGKQAVIETPRGLMVDYGRLGGVNLAAAAVVHREQQKLQKQFDILKQQVKAPIGANKSK